MVRQIEKKITLKSIATIGIKFTVLMSVMVSTLSLAQPLFEDDTEAVGGPFYIGETWGASWGDLNGDLYPDLFSSNHGALNSILRNNGDGTFAEIVEQVDSERIWTGAPAGDIHGGSWADFDNDGDQDLFVTRSSIGTRFQLMENSGLGGFTEEGGRLGIGGSGVSFGRLPLLFDYTNDGNLDLALARNGANGLVLFKWDTARNRYVAQTSEAGIVNECLRNTSGFASDLFKNGKLHYICVSESSASEKVYDTTTLPFTDVTSSIDSVGTNTDVVLADFNNDLSIDMLVNRGRVRPSGAGKISSNRVEAWFTVGGANDLEDSITFSADGPISVNVFARNVGEPGGLRIGSAGAVPTSLPVTLNPNDVSNLGLVENRNERAVYIGYDDASEEWTIILASGGRPEAAYIIVNGTELSEPEITGQSRVDSPLAPTFLFNNGSRLQNSGSRGIGAIQCGGIAAADFDNDMDVDVYMACRDSISNFANRLYLNDGSGNFSLLEDHGAEGIIGSGIESLTGTSGMAVTADYNVDGFMDVFVTNGNRLFPLLSKDGFTGGGPGQFFRNLANNGNHWLEIDLQGVASNRDGFGAKVFVTAGGVSQFREQNGQYHRWSHDSRRIHFGLGANISADVTIEWPDGTSDTFTGVTSDQLYLAVQGGDLTPRTPTLNPPSVSISTDNVIEGETASVAISIFPPSSEQVTVEYQTFDGNANPNADINAIATLDYTPVAGTLTFDPFETERIVSVPSLPDIEDENDELLSVRLSNPFNVLLNQAQGLIELDDDDDADINGPVITIADATVLEGGLAEFAISISENPTQTVIVEFETVSGSAVAGEDYEFRSGRVSFQPGTQLTVFRRIVTLSDNIVEANESFGLRLFDPQNANLLNGLGTATLLDEDTVFPEISIDNISVDEGSASSLIVTLSEPTTVTVLVGFATSNVSAIAGVDYVATAGRLTFLPGEQSQVIDLITLQDTAPDGDETFNVTLSNANNATLADASGLVTIVDDEDALPFINVAGVSVTEGDSATLVVSLSFASSSVVSVNYASVDDTALANSDYIASNGQLVFAPGELSKTIVLATVADIDNEQIESFNVQLGEPIGGLAGQLTAVVAIIDDDDAPINGPVVTISDSTSLEGDVIEFTVTLSQASDNVVSVNFGTSDITAQAGFDYEARLLGRVNFQPGELSMIRRINTLEDDLVEPDETFAIHLSGAVNANILDSRGVVTIIDNVSTSEPLVSISNGSIEEGGRIAFTFTLSQASADVVTVDFGTSDGSALAGSDYQGRSIGRVVFQPGQLSMIRRIITLDDNLLESDETFTMQLSDPVNASLSDSIGIGTIIDNDSAPTNEPTVSISNGSIEEGGRIAFTFSLSQVSSEVVSVNFVTSDGSALAGSDYQGRPIGRVVFQPGQLSMIRRIITLDDNLLESDETFTMQLSDPVNASILDSVGIGTIIDNDNAPTNEPTVSISNGSIEEGGRIAFTFALSQASAEVVTVDFGTADGTAAAGSDYQARAIGRVSFQAGELSMIRRITTLEDGLLESDETFLMQLSNPVNASILESTGIGTIIDND